MMSSELVMAASQHHQHQHRPPDYSLCASHLPHGPHPSQQIHWNSASLLLILLVSFSLSLFGWGVTPIRADQMIDGGLGTCCACDEAKYEMVFQGLWSRYTHPREFPSNLWLTHFSDIIGASHSSDFRIFEYGGYASEGVRQVAELGVSRKLESELKIESEKIR